MLTSLIDAETVINNMENKVNELPGRLSTMVTEVAFIYQSNIMDAAPVRTGNAQSATRVENINDFTSRVYPDEHIAPYIEFIINGTQPHEIIITPKEAKALNTPYGLFKKVVVNHPGTEPNDYFSDGASNAESEVQAEINELREWLLS